MEKLNAKLCRALKALSVIINTACELYNSNYLNSYQGISWWEMFVSQCIYKQPQPRAADRYGAGGCLRPTSHLTKWLPALFCGEFIRVNSATPNDFYFSYFGL